VRRGQRLDRPPRVLARRARWPVASIQATRKRSAQVRGQEVFSGTTLAVVGDYSMAVVGVRQDLTYKLLDQAIITDDTGAIVYNLPQQDMLALRVVARFGFAIAKPVSRNAPEAASRSPCSTRQRRKRGTPLGVES
jgi:hypothetical protein